MPFKATTELLRKARRLGLRAEVTGGGHYLLTASDGRTGLISATAGSGGSIKGSERVIRDLVRGRPTTRERMIEQDSARRVKSRGTGPN